MHKNLMKTISKSMALIMLFTTAFFNVNCIKVLASDGSDSRKIDVWDFGGVQALGDLYNNNITADILDKASVKCGSFATTAFGDLSIVKPDLKDRMYYFESDGTTPGANSYGSWGPAANAYDDGYSSNGSYYCNGAGGNKKRFLTVKNVAAGDKISVYGGTNNANETIHFVHASDLTTLPVTADASEVQDSSDVYTTKPQRVDFVAQYSGSYLIYVSATGGKPYFHRVVKTPGVKVSGRVDLNGKSVPAGYGLKFINQVTNEGTEVSVNADNTFNAVLGSGCKYAAVLSKGSNAFKISNDTKLVSISDYGTAGAQNITGLKVTDNVLAKINGNIVGIDKNYDLSKLKITLTPPADSFSDPVTAKIDTKTMAYSAAVEQGLKYKETVSGVNDYDTKASGSDVNIKADTAQDITFTKRPVYTASGKFINLSSTAEVKSITFTNVDDGYTYSGTVAGDGYIASLRDGAYSVAAVCSDNYETGSHIVVNKKNAAKDILFNKITGWNLVNVTDKDISAGTYKGLTLKKETGGFKVNGNSLSVKPGSSIVIPVAKGQRVTVSGWNSGTIYFSEDPASSHIDILTIPGTSTASAPAQLSHTAKDDGTVTLNVTGADPAYLIAINCVKLIDRVSDLYVGDSSKPNNYATVKDALDAAAKMNPASEAERITIHIAPGTYREQLKISTPYITLVNSDPSKYVKITWYYGFGYKYYSSGADGFYDSARAADKFLKNHVSDGKWGGSVYLTSTATDFKAENIVFENSFNKYVTQEELDDGAELCKTFPQSYSGTLLERKSTSDDVASKVQTERAAAMIIEADEAEFKNCSFIGSQDTLYTGGDGSSRSYFRNCFIEGNTDYIFGDGNSVFENCTLNFCGYSDQVSGGYITAAKDTAKYGYLFNRCTVTANNNSKQAPGFFGRTWGPKARVTFMNTVLQNDSIIDPTGWTSMNGQPEDAHYAEYNTTYNSAAVDTSKRRAPVLSDAGSIASAETYLGDWTPKYLQQSSKPFTVDSSFNLTSLQPNKTLSAKTTVTNNNSAVSKVLGIAALYDGNDKMVKVTYISREIPVGSMETFNADFNLPADVSSCKVKVFVWDGTNFDNTTMKVLSNVVTLK